jgi:hypothetical protein
LVEVIIVYSACRRVGTNVIFWFKGNKDLEEEIIWLEKNKRKWRIAL